MAHIVYKQNNLVMLTNTSTKTLEADKLQQPKSTSQSSRVSKKGSMIVAQPNIRSFVNKKYHESVEGTLRQFKIGNKPAKSEQVAHKEIRPASIHTDKKVQNSLTISEQLIRSSPIYKQLERQIDEEQTKFKEQETELALDYQREQQRVSEMAEDNKLLSAQVETLKKKLKNLQFEHNKQQHTNMFLLETINQMNQDQFFNEEEEEDYEQEYQIDNPNYYGEEAQESDSISYYSQTYYINNVNQIMPEGGSQPEEEQA